MSLVPVSGMTDAAVLEYKLHRWDYQLLKTHNVPMADYDKARSAYQQLSSTSKAETKAAHQEQYLVQRRLLLTKLMELRAAALAKGTELRTASATISIATGNSDKVLRDMLTETTRHSKKMHRS